MLWATRTTLVNDCRKKKPERRTIVALPHEEDNDARPGASGHGPIATAHGPLTEKKKEGKEFYARNIMEPPLVTLTRENARRNRRPNRKEKESSRPQRGGHRSTLD